jgi:outer membrane protein OmpA-like peptidoglycan-associated protein
MDSRADELRAKAEAAYFEMEMDAALRYVDQAVSLCMMGCSQSKQASLKVLRGMIVFLAQGDEAKARVHFRKGLEVDPDVTTDPMITTPAVEKLFHDERARFLAERSGKKSSGAGPVAAPPSPYDTPAEGEDEPEAQASGGEEGGIRRTVKWNRGFLEAGYSLTMASAHENMRAASSPTLDSAGDDPQLDNRPDNDSYILSGTHGCDAPPGQYCVRVTQGFSAFAHGLHLGGGYFVTERFGVGGRVRWNPNSGDGVMSNILVGFRTYYQLSEPKQTGLHTMLFAGLMLGQIQVRPKQRPTTPTDDIERPWVRTGLGGLEVGGKVAYRFKRNLGVFASPEIYTLFPDFSFGLQVTAGLDFTFGEAEHVFYEPGTEVAPAQIATPSVVDEDGDGVPDDRDRCPSEPEDRDGFQDDDGCPDPDNDGDGIPDEQDRCPGQAEDMDGFQDDDGCPDRDNDGDGVPDDEDQCPLTPGPGINHGCPVADRDGDGLADRFDNCPDEPGSLEHMGCPKPQLVQIEERRLKILDAIYFKRNGHVIEKRSYKLLDQLAHVINAHPEIAHVRIEGHTDATGSAAVNRKLSQRRADAVMRHLTTRGKVSRHRLSAHGFGPDRPINPNATTEAEHAENRRVEFMTLTE